MIINKSITWTQGVDTSWQIAATIHNRQLRKRAEGNWRRNLRLIIDPNLSWSPEELLIFLIIPTITKPDQLIFIPCECFSQFLLEENMLWSSTAWWGGSSASAFEQPQWKVTKNKKFVASHHLIETLEPLYETPPTQWGTPTALQDHWRLPVTPHHSSYVDPPRSREPLDVSEAQTEATARLKQHGDEVRPTGLWHVGVTRCSNNNRFKKLFLECQKGK